MDNLFIITAVAGVTELIKRLRAKDTDGAITILSAVAIGVVAGLFGIAGVTVVGGVITGLSAAGVVAVATRIG